MATMRVALAGGTGFIGRALAESLSSAGHALVPLAHGASAGAWEAAVAEADAVINLAGANIAAGRWTAARKKLLRDSRIDSTRAIVEAVGRAARKPKILINASAVGYYGDRGGEELTEDSPAGEGFLARLCRDWEAEAFRAKTHGVRVVALRLGIVLGPGGGALGKMLPPFRFFAGGPLGTGLQWMSWISLADVIGLVHHIVAAQIDGPVNAVAPNPVTNRDFSDALGEALGRPSWLPAPALALRLALGEMAEMLLGGQRVRPKRALESGYAFRHPDLRSALEASIR